MTEVHRPRAALDTVLHRGSGTVIAAFRCPRADPRFAEPGPIENDIFVFPRSSVWIRRAGGPSFVADQTVATLYNRGQVYGRAAVSEEGDRCDWFAVPREAAVEAVLANGLQPAADGPFRVARAPVSAPTYLAQRRVFLRARSGAASPELDESVFALLDDVVRSAASASGARPDRQWDKEAPALAEEIRSLLSARFEERWSLSRLQERFGVSAFRLCRAFRRVTGASIHAYQVSVRLRAALERIEPRSSDLTSVALDLGFSSHSHFTLAFRRAFGLPPSAWRSAVPPRHAHANMAARMAQVTIPWTTENRTDDRNRSSIPTA
jgi:AraC-like DNA-binding protein